MKPRRWLPALQYAFKCIFNEQSPTYCSVSSILPVSQHSSRADTLLSMVPRFAYLGASLFLVSEQTAQVRYRLMLLWSTLLLYTQQSTMSGAMSDVVPFLGCLRSHEMRGSYLHEATCQACSMLHKGKRGHGWRVTLDSLIYWSYTTPVLLERTLREHPLVKTVDFFDFTHAQSGLSRL